MDRLKVAIVGSFKALRSDLQSSMDRLKGRSSSIGTSIVLDLQSSMDRLKVDVIISRAAV